MVRILRQSLHVDYSAARCHKLLLFAVWALLAELVASLMHPSMKFSTLLI